MNSKIYKNEVAVFTPDEINTSLESTNRQYLQGDLKKEQLLSYIYSNNSEIGISDYKEYCHDDPHYHDFITETNYVITGRLCLHILDTGKDYVIEAGGVFSVPPKVKHVLKIQPGTRIIFFKNHSMNDKHVVSFEGKDFETWYADKNF